MSQDNSVLTPWLDATVSGLLEVAPMFGLETGRSQNGVALPSDHAGAYISLEGDDWVHLVGLVSTPAMLADLTGAMLGGMGEAADSIAESEITDAVGEMVNMIAGQVKSVMQATHGEMTAGLPMFLRGEIQSGSEALADAASVDLGSITVHLLVQRTPLLGEMRERRRMQSAIKDREALLSAILATAADGVLIVDERGSIESANAAAGRIFDRSARKLVGQEVDLWMPDWSSCDCPTSLIGREIEGRREDKAAVPLEVSVSRFHVSGGTKYAAIIRDISARKQAEAELNLAHERVVTLSRTAGMAEVATDMIHNIGNLLNSVNVSSSVVMTTLKNSKLSTLFKAIELLREHEEDFDRFFKTDKGKKLPSLFIALSDRLRAEYKHIAEELENLKKGVDDIHRVVQKHEEHAQKIDVARSIDIQQVLSQVLAEHQEEILDTGIRLKLEPMELPPALLDGHKLQQIVSRLVRNAIESMAGAEHKELQVRLARPESDRIQIVVRDTGVGIEPTDLTQIFQAGRERGCVGHGLHDSALVAKQMNGELMADSSGVGQGATFTLALPFSPVDPT